MAGFLVENVAPVRAEPLVQMLHVMAVPVFVIFFAMAGADLRVADVRGALAARHTVSAAPGAGGLRGRRAGAGLGRCGARGRRYAWTGLVTQAGVALGLAAIVADRLPRIGVAMQTLIVGVIAFNESVGPVVFRGGLELAGEIRER